MAKATGRPDHPVRAIAYTRVSTGKQAESGLGLTDQIETIEAAVARRGWQLLDHAEDAGISGKTVAKRPALAAALARLDRGEADVLVAAKLDRLTRSVSDLAALLDRAARHGWAVVVLDVDVDSTTPAGEMVATMVGAAAQYERRLIAARTAAGHRVRRDRGERAGQAPLLPGDVRAHIAAEAAAGRSLRSIAAQLNAEGVPTARGGRWHASTVAHVVRSVALDRELASSAT